MKAPVIWLKDFTDIDVSVKELADQMTLTGSKVEEVIDYKLSGVYAGKILSVEDHPDSDHLHILKVDFGRDRLDIAFRSSAVHLMFMRACFVPLLL